MKIKIKKPFILLVMEVLFIIFSIHVSPFVGIFTLRNIFLLVVCLEFLYIWSKQKMRKLCLQDFGYVICTVIIFIYILSISLYFGTFGNHYSVFSSFFNYTILVVMFPLMFTSVEKDFNRFVNAFIVVTLIQAIICLASFGIPSVRTFLYQIQEFDENWLANRIVGLGIAGAKGSVYLFCGYLLNLYYILFYNNKFKYYLSLIIIFVAIALVGRTGFYMTLAITVVAILLSADKWNIRKIRRMIMTYSGIALTTVALFYVATNFLEIDMAIFTYTINRLDELWTTNATLNALANFTLPEITLDLFFYGEGLIKGYSAAGTRIWHDSGYVQRYFSMGIIPAVVSYVYLALYMLHFLKKIDFKKKRLFWLAAIVLLFIVEYKEPFIFALALPAIIIISMRLESKNHKYLD